jgi:CheY-like chemotaxis protein
MGGRIGYHDNPRGGSVFWVELPITEPEPSIVTNTASTAAPEIAPLRILLADDLDLTRSVTADFLRRAGHAVTEVANGEAAIDAARAQDFDVILTDMRMPIMDGLEATRGIRAIPGPRGRTPVVLVTADLVALGEGASGQSGVDLCLMKPFTRPELLAAVAKAANGRQAAAHDVLDGTTFGELKDSLGATKFGVHLRAATHRIEDLIAMLKRPGAAESAIVREAAHDLVGVSGLLGLTALSETLRRFDLAEDRVVAIEPLREAATEAVLVLRQQQVPAGASPQGDGQC